MRIIFSGAGKRIPCALRSTVLPGNAVLIIRAGIIVTFFPFGFFFPVGVVTFFIPSLTLGFKGSLLFSGFFLVEKISDESIVVADVRSAFISVVCDSVFVEEIRFFKI